MRDVYLKSNMMLQRGKVHALHIPDHIVWLRNLCQSDI